jgi:hypothetical protein
MTFINVSGRAFNTIHANDFSFFEEVNQIVQEEPNNALDPEPRACSHPSASRRASPSRPTNG